MAEQTVTLGPGQSQVVSFQFMPPEARTYQVAVDGLSGSFQATTPASETLLLSGALSGQEIMPSIGSTFGFLYWQGSALYVHIDSAGSIDAPVNLGGDMLPRKMVFISESEFLVLSGVSIAVRHFVIQGGIAQLVGNIDHLGDANTRLFGAIKLSSGHIVVSWYQHLYGLGGDIRLYFAYRRDDGTWQIMNAVVHNASTVPSTRGTLCQHPADGSIWSFTLTDGNYNVHSVRLIEGADSLSIASVNSNFTTPADGLLSREGEIPCIVAIPDLSSGSILLAYQNNSFKIFVPVAGSSFVKGANIVVMNVDQNGGKTLRAILDAYIERVSIFALGFQSDGNIWIAGKAIDENNPTATQKFTLYTFPEAIPEALSSIDFGFLFLQNWFLYDKVDGIYRRVL